MGLVGLMRLMVLMSSLSVKSDTKVVQKFILLTFCLPFFLFLNTVRRVLNSG